MEKTKEEGYRKHIDQLIEDRTTDGRTSNLDDQQRRLEIIHQQ